MRLRALTVVLSLGLGCYAVACGASADRPPVTNAPPKVEQGVAPLPGDAGAGSGASAAGLAAGAAGTTGTTGATAPAATSDATRFRCGKTTCRVGAESCCAASRDEGVCVPTASPGPGDKSQLLASQIEACESVKLTYALSEIGRCDESIDCGKDQACCSQFLFGGASTDLCVPIKKSGLSPCEFDELCYEGQPCRAKGAVCVEGTCQKPVKALACGGAACSGAKSACCGDPLSCREPSACEGEPRVRCVRNADCLQGQVCQVTPGGTACVGLPDFSNAQMTCERDADCPRRTAFCPKVRCRPSDLQGVKACTCL